MAFLQRVLVALDGSYAAKRLLSFAHGLARAHASEIVLCSVMDEADGSFAAPRGVVQAIVARSVLPVVVIRQFETIGASDAPTLAPALSDRPF